MRTVETLVDGSVELDRRPRQPNRLPRTRQPAEPHRPDKARLFAASSDAAIKARPLGRAAGDCGARRDGRQGSGKTAAQLARAFQLEAHRTEVAIQPAAPVDNRDIEVRQTEPLLLRTLEQQLVESTKAELAAAQTAIKPGPHRSDPPDTRHSEARHSADDQPLGGKIGPLRVADDNVAQHLGAHPDPFDLIGCGQIERGQLVGDNVIGDPLAGKPAGRQREQQQAGKRKQHHTPPASLRAARPLQLRDVCRRGQRVFVVLNHAPHTCADARLKAMLRATDRPAMACEK